MQKMGERHAYNEPYRHRTRFCGHQGETERGLGSGDYARIGTTLQIVGENLAEALDVSPDSKVLDVAAGNGNATLAFARRWCNVTSTDYVEKLLAQGRARAEAEALNITFQIADAEQLPFENDAFDAVVSTFGVMFAPNQLKSASEILRVCRPAGKIGLANWTSEGFIGQLFKALGKHVPPPAGVNLPHSGATEHGSRRSSGPKAGPSQSMIGPSSSGIGRQTIL